MREIEQYGLSGAQMDQLMTYRDMVRAYNEHTNLTRLTSDEDFLLRHYADSLAPLQFDLIGEGASLIDVGTGAGFPAIVLKIARPDIRLTMLDSLNKRLIFLKDVCDALGIEAEIVHARAEEGARTRLRESFDIAAARAVANMRTLSEYLLPYVKVGGQMIAYKGESGAEEAREAAEAIRRLGGAKAKVLKPDLGELNHTLIISRKERRTPDIYPRKAPLPTKSPIG